jgi:hypothetical protein
MENYFLGFHLACMRIRSRAFKEERVGLIWKRNKASCVLGIKALFFYLKGLCMSLCMDYNIYQMSVTAFGTNPRDPIFNELERWHLLF